MCDNNETQAATAAQTTKPQRSVEDMLRDIAFVLRMTGQVKADLRRERAAKVDVQRRTAKREEVMAVSM